MPSSTPAAPRPLWIARPAVDLVIGCGGWSLPLLALAYYMPASSNGQWAAVFYTLALVANYPHYMATIYRAYGRADLGQHQLYTVWATLALVALGAIAHVQVWLIPILFTAYIFWSPWHYSGQNYGLLLMFARRGDLTVSETARRALRIAFVASYVMLLASFNEGPSTDPLVLSLGLPTVVTRSVSGIAMAVFAGAGLWGMFALARGARQRSLIAPVMLYLTQALWFVAPTAVSWASGMAAPQTRYSTGVLALMHSAQYLWITQYFAKREQGAGWHAGRYWFAVIAGGAALFLPIPWLASYAAHVDFVASMLIVTAIVNIHHFMVDGVVWKLRDTRVAKALTTQAAAAEGGVAALPRPRPALLWRGAAVAAVAGLAALAVIDQWRYRLTLLGADTQSLQTAVTLNPYDSTAQSRLLNALVDSGRTDEARAHLDRAIQRRPDDVDAVVNAGVLARREGRAADAEKYWQEAVRLAPAHAHVRLYLAELLHEAGRAADAVPHYRAYLELVVEQRQSSRPDPRVIVPAIVKFGDALAAAGQAEPSRSQYQLAERMAQQTGLTDLAAEARQRLAAGH